MAKYDEEIVVLEKQILFPATAPQGLVSTDMKHYEDLISQKASYMPRSAAETDVRFKQIIPYFVFTYNDTYFLMQRRSNASEVRLQNKYSLGIGGHLRKDDLVEGGLTAWGEREFHEEVSFKGSYSIEPLGIINDETTDVGKVHTGFVFLLKGDSSEISVKSELKSGRLATIKECVELYDRLEQWSAWVVDYLKVR